MVNAGGDLTPTRIQSKDFGKSWAKATFGHNGSRRGTLERTGPGHVPAEGGLAQQR